MFKYPETKGRGSMDGYEFSLEIVRSPALVALVTAIATSLGTGLCTYFAATHGKDSAVESGGSDGCVYRAMASAVVGG